MIQVEEVIKIQESLISNHPFIDGNIRIGYFILRYFLLENNMDIKATQDEKYDFKKNSTRTIIVRTDT